MNWQLDRISAVAPRHLLCVRRRDLACIRLGAAHRGRFPSRWNTTTCPPTVIFIILSFRALMRLSPREQQRSSLFL
ncbi:hypothetical protein, partial [Xanthomonas fragariae]|uniref:hypothetical protein n=1 Tax=Xanthomonas fragariae TaxID=48664 RepID=UPI001F27A913